MHIDFAARKEKDMRRTMRAALGMAVVIVLSGCAGSPTFLEPYSEIASHQARLYRILMVLSIVVFLFVETWLVYNIVRFRKHPDDESLPKQIYGNNRLEVIWTGIPLLLVATIFGLTVSTVNAVSAPEPAQDDLHLQVVGHQWWWEFDYPDLGIVTANELHVPANATVQVDLNSVDVIHSFWIPQLSGKMDVIPGQTNHLWLKTENIGEYHGQCAEFCGLNHANMRVKVVVESESDFKAWVANQQEPAVQPQTDLQRQGQEIVTTGICNSCHTLGDNQANNEIGPNLTHLMSRSVFAGATYELNETNLRNWLVNNQEMKPGNDMAINPKSDEIDPLIAYLLTLK